MGLKDILIRIAGDGSDAEDELARLAADLQGFDQIDAEATADVETAGARAKIKALRAELAALAARDYDVDVDVDVDTDRGVRGVRGFFGLLKGLWDGVGGLLTGGFQQLGSNVTGFGGQAGTAGVGVTFLAKASAAAGAAIGVVLFTAIGVAVTALAALASSALVAAAAIGALAIGGFALLVPMIGLAIGAIQRFKEQSEQAGTAAHALRSAGERIGQVFQRVVGPAADAVFRGLAQGLNALVPTLRSLTPEFTQFGRIAGGALRALLTEFSSPQWRQFFSQLVSAAGQALPPLVSSFISLARILRNIATGALPFLVSGFRSVAQGLQGVATSTEGIDLSGVVSHLRSWLGLAQAVGSVFLGFIRAAAPAGQQLVDWLTQGAQRLAQWVNSAEGQERIKQFFTDTLPLVQQFVALMGNLAITAIQVFQAIAPLLTVVISAFNVVIGVINFLLDLFNRIPAPIRSWALALAGPLGALSNIKAAIDLIPGAFNAVKSVATSVFGAIKGVVQDVADFFSNLPGPIQTVAGIIAGLAGAPLAAIAGIAGAIQKIASIVPGVIGVLGGLASKLTSIGGTAKENFERMFAAVDLTSFLSTLQQQFGPQLAVIGQQAGSNLGQKLAAGLASANATVRTTAQQVIASVKQQAQAGNPEARAVMAQLGDAMAGGLRSKQGAVRGAGRQVGRGAQDGAKAGGSGIRGVGDFLGAIFGEGVKSKEGAARRGGRELGAGAKSGAAEGGRDSRSVGEAIGSGIHGGIVSWVARIIAAAVEAVRQAMARARAQANAKSPSKVMYALGQDIGKGLELGMRDSTKSVVGAAAAMVSEALGGAVALSLGGLSLPVGQGSALAGAGAAGNTYNIDVHPLAGGGSPDVDTFLAQLDAKVRARGG